MTSPKHRLLVFLGTGLVACLWVTAAELLAFDAEKKALLSPVAAESLQTGQFLGALSCASSNCHGSVKPRDVYDVKQNEYFTWLKQDRHAHAYDVLLNEKSARIARNMHMKSAPSKSTKCLACHALDAPKHASAQPLDVGEGVSCEGCHGPAGGWIRNHTADHWTHDQSVKTGMTDLRNPAIRAETCLACHLGDRQKTVDHELIAAGHPRLIFELDNYSAAMPAHWVPLPHKTRERDIEKTEGTRVWAVGQAVAFREGMLQLARRARSESWPEFSEMECSGCHHSLKDGGWRQERGYTFRAGLPEWSPARFAVLRHIVSVFAPQEQTPLKDGVKRLSGHMAKMATPTKIVASEATALAEIMARVISKIVQAHVDNGVSKKLAGKIVNDAPYLINAGVHSVEQAVMAINALVISMARSDSAMSGKEVTKVMDALYDNIQDPEHFDRDRFARQMEDLQRLIQ